MMKLVMLNKEEEKAVNGHDYTQGDISELIIITNSILHLAEVMEEYADNHEGDTSTCSIAFSLISILMDPVDDFVNKSFSLNQKNGSGSGET
ncbi:hypothetical protein AGMMS49942_03650 [Spirochaetia bacterium]|nr:hypothetical protein AGMMS49942_03650 [Spirochaetia bacterium]